MRLIPADMIAIATIFQEAEGEPMDGKVAVGEVIRRRTKTKYSSDGTIEGTCLRPAQFSGWNTNGNRVKSLRLDDTDKVTSDCMWAWSESMTSNLVPGAVLYHSTSIEAPSWAKPQHFVRQIGKHRFFSAA